MTTCVQLQMTPACTEGPVGQSCSVCVKQPSYAVMMSLFLQIAKSHYFCLRRPYTAMTEEHWALSQTLLRDGIKAQHWGGSEPKPPLLLKFGL